MALTTVLFRDSISTESFPIVSEGSDVSTLAQAAIWRGNDSTASLSTRADLSDGSEAITDVVFDTLGMEENTKAENLYDATAVLIGLAAACGVLGFILPVLWIAAGTLLIAAVMMGIEGKMAEMEAAMPSEQMPETDSLICTVNFDAIDDFLKTSEAKEEEERFSQEDLIGFNRRNREGSTRHFTSVTRDLPYLYRINGVEEVEGKPYNEVVLEHVVKLAFGLPAGEDALERLNSCIDGSGGEFLQQRALQVSAVLKLLGDENKILTNLAAARLACGNWGAAFDSTPTVKGKIVINVSFPPLEDRTNNVLMFSVKHEEAALYTIDDFDSKERVPVATYRTSRTYQVFPPHQETGEIDYKVVRKFERKL